MPRRPRTVGLESSLELARKAEILEREMATQRAALDRLKEMASNRQPEEPAVKKPVRRSA